MLLFLEGLALGFLAGGSLAVAIALCVYLVPEEGGL